MVQRVLEHKANLIPRSTLLSRQYLLSPAWLWGLVFIYILGFSFLSVLKHNTYHTYTFDLGVMSQVLWNITHGHWFEISLDRTMDADLTGSYLVFHFRPIFLLLAPFYWLWPDPRQLLILQSIALGLGAIPLFWIAQRELSGPWLRVGLIISYLLYPALGYINFFDFHPVALTIPLLLLAYWALLEQRQLLFWTAVLLTLATKEELVVPVGAFAIYCLTQPSWRRTGFRLLALTAFWAVLSFAVIVYFNEGRAYRYVDAWSHLLSLLSSGADRGANTQPSTIDLLTPESLLYLLYLLFPLGFLPLLGPGLLAVSIPSLTYLLLSSRPALHSFDSQYSAVLIPWLFLATMQALTKLERWPGPNGQQARPKRLALYLLLTCTVVSNLLLNSTFWYWLSGSFRPGPNHVEIKRALALIPPQTGVATINSFGAQLAHRRYLMGLDRYSTPLPQSHLSHIDYVLLDLVDCRAIRSPNPRNTYAEMVLQLIDSQEFGVRYWSDPILLLERDLPSGPELDEMRNYVHKLESEKRPCWP